MKAIITGITGQDGSYLAEFLLEKGYEVHGMVRRNSTPNYHRIEHILDEINLFEGDLGDTSSLTRAIQEIQPNEIYNLAAMSFVKASFDTPEATSNITGLGLTRILEAVRMIKPDTKIYQASSSEMFGSAEPPQSEETIFHPKSPYGVSKVYAHLMATNYRESHDMFVCSGILFNHESPRRGLEFVTRKITDGIAKIKLGLQDKISLGNLNAQRDWGFAGDYVEAMWKMLQLDEPKDFVIGTGKSHSVGEFLHKACEVAGLKNIEDHLVIDPKYMRPAEVNYLLADPTKSNEELDWKHKVNFEQLVEMMVNHDLKININKEDYFYILSK